MSISEAQKLYSDGKHQFFLLGWEEQEETAAVQTNQYIIAQNNTTMLLDPGGAHVFPRVLANVAELFPIKSVQHIFYSHQDPDVSSGITLWLSMAESATVHISGLWTRFLPHFGVYDQKRIKPIPDKGGTIDMGGARLQCIPAHYLHSTGQFSLYDPVSRILFSGDIGAAVFPEGQRYQIVRDFSRHLQFMEGFHKRYMASSKACQAWVRHVRQLDVEMIAPQHGAVMQGEHVAAFLNWFDNLKCGIDLM
ncbi:MAG: MBL fold metallo-hydrolase [Synergistales bacterium]|nr:MBL fold metallo-hydrolase [Synergistales bacterium]